MSQSTKFGCRARLEGPFLVAGSWLVDGYRQPGQSFTAVRIASLLRGIVSYTNMPRHPAVSRELLNAALEGFERQQTRIEEQITHVRSMLGIRKRGRPPKNPAAQESPKPPRKLRKMSAAARKRIGDATRKRWAALRKAKGQ